jgi:hypothetical protein
LLEQTGCAIIIIERRDKHIEVDLFNRRLDNLDISVVPLPVYSTANATILPKQARYHPMPSTPKPEVSQDVASPAEI